MTIGTIVITVLGLAYIVWSIYAVRDVLTVLFSSHKLITVLWVGVHIALAALALMCGVLWVIVNWDKVVF